MRLAGDSVRAIKQAQHQLNKIAIFPDCESISFTEVFLMKNQPGDGKKFTLSGVVALLVVTQCLEQVFY